MSEGKRRREHYVPRFYLDFFGDLLFVFDKKTAKVFQSTTKNIAFEEGFYDLHPTIDLEGEIAANENRMKNGLRELISKSNPLAISEDSRIKVSLSIALQSLRTKEQRAEIKEAGGKIMTELTKSRPEFKNLPFKVIMKDEMAQAIQAQVIVSDAVPRIAWIIGNSRWTLFVNRTKIPFWTSDNPVALYNPLSESEGLVGFAVEGNQTHFPLNCNLLLTILDPRSYDTPPIKIIKDPRMVSYENELQLYNATRFVFSNSDDFSMAKEIRKQDKAIKHERERMVIKTSERFGRSFIELIKKRARTNDVNESG